MNISLPSDKMSVDEAIDWLDRNAPDETSTIGEAIYTVLDEINHLRKENKNIEKLQLELDRITAEYRHYMKTH